MKLLTGYTIFQIWTMINSSPPVPHICVGELGQHWFRQWLVACSAPSHYLNQYWLVVNLTLGNQSQWNSSPNTKLFIYEKAFEHVVCDMEAVLSMGRWVTCALRGYLFWTIQWIKETKVTLFGFYENNYCMYKNVLSKVLFRKMSPRYHRWFSRVIICKSCLPNKHTSDTT